jgi:hypothetical protein
VAAARAEASAAGAAMRVANAVLQRWTAQLASDAVRRAADVR